jgi:hypothetical protein
MQQKVTARPDPIGLYRSLRAASAQDLARGADSGRGTRFVAYGRGCSGGPSFLVREESAEGEARAWAILATYETSGIEDSSFATPDEALAFVAEAVAALRPSWLANLFHRA